MIEVILFFLGGGIGALMCWVRMREPYLDLKAEYDAIVVEHNQTKEENHGLWSVIESFEADQKNPWA